MAAALFSGESLAGIGSMIASLMFLWAMVRDHFPKQIESWLGELFDKLARLFNPYVEITFAEYVGERLKRSEAYEAIQVYLSSSSASSFSASAASRRLKGEMSETKSVIVLTMDDGEIAVDAFRGAKLLWRTGRFAPANDNATTISWYPSAADDRRYYRLAFHRRHRKLIETAYLPHVVKEGRAIAARKRQKRLFTNSSSYDHEYRKLMWSHVPLKHPATFDTLAMDPDEKKDIVDDLLAFRASKDYYERIGKPWKRGYLLYGPPGTGKSTMIAAMANLLDYDVYDLELTSVKNNTALRKLFIETTNKSIIVIEDIDCSLDLSGKRKPAAAAAGDVGVSDDPAAAVAEKAPAPGGDKEESKVTLSGLLNFIDGIWSSCGGERLIVFTTNHVEKLDPALVRRGRMDKHVELSYCRFGGFKVLARNYLGLDFHPMFETIRRLLEENDITPADVAEELMPKNGAAVVSPEMAGACLEGLVRAIHHRIKSESMSGEKGRGETGDEDAELDGTLELN